MSYIQHVRLFTITRQFLLSFAMCTWVACICFTVFSSCTLYHERNRLQSHCFLQINLLLYSMWNSFMYLIPWVKHERNRLQSHCFLQINLLLYSLWNSKHVPSCAETRAVKLEIFSLSQVNKMCSLHVPHYFSFMYLKPLVNMRKTRL